MGGSPSPLAAGEEPDLSKEGDGRSKVTREDVVHNFTSQMILPRGAWIIGSDVKSSGSSCSSIIRVFK